MTIAPPAPPYVGPPAHSSGNDNKPIYWLVIHSTVSPCVPGGARAIANYFKSQGAGGSAHYVIDPREVIQAAWDSVDYWHAPPSTHSLGFEMCDEPGPVPGDGPFSAAAKAARKVWRWRRPEQKAMLRRTATVVARAALAYGVPIRYVGPVRRRLGVHGITTHASVSIAFRQSTHWDPGFWPRRRFIRMVKAEAKAILAAGRG